MAFGAWANFERSAWLPRWGGKESIQRSHQQPSPLPWKTLYKATKLYLLNNRAISAGVKSDLSGLQTLLQYFLKELRSFTILPPSPLKGEGQNGNALQKKTLFLARAFLKVRPFAVRWKNRSICDQRLLLRPSEGFCAVFYLEAGGCIRSRC